MTYCYFIISWTVVFTATLRDYRLVCAGPVVILLFRHIARLASVLVLISILVIVPVLVLALLSSIRRVHAPCFDVVLVL